MTKFRISVSLLDENISAYKEYKSKSMVDIDSIYNSLKNLESGWNDVNTKTFMNIAKNDKYKLDNYFKKLDSFYRQLESIKKSFENLLAKYGYNRRGTLNYNDDYYQDCIRSLNNVLEYLNSALHYANCCYFKDDYITRARVYALRNDIRKMKNVTRNLSGRVTGFRNGVNRILGNANHNVSRLGNAELPIEPFLYNWSLVDSRIVKKDLDEYRIDGVNQQDISTTSEVLSTESYLRGTKSAANVANNVVDGSKVGDDNVYHDADGVIFHAAKSSDVKTDSEVLSTESYLRGTNSAANVANNVVDSTKVGDDNAYHVAQDVIFHAAKSSDVKTDSEVLSTESYLRGTNSAANVTNNVVDGSKVGDDNVYHDAKDVVFHTASTKNIDSSTLFNDSQMMNPQTFENIKGKTVDSSLVGDDNEYYVSDNVNIYAGENASSKIDLNELNYRSK